MIHMTLACVIWCAMMNLWLVLLA